MSFSNKLKEIDTLQAKIAGHGALGKDILNKIYNKFRLDWNYYSNRMEGNTLTVEETKSVMVGILDIHNKPTKDVREMEGHDKAIQSILKMGKGEMNISETRIKELHKQIMFEETQPEIEKIGQWKTVENYVINYKNERFDFTRALDVPDEIHTLLNWLGVQKEKNADNKKDALHPVEIAFEFHVRYLTIHPFHDGNGRTGRILTNIILISYGFPPLYIKDEDKVIYYRLLADVQGYNADKNELFSIISDLLIRSLKIVQDAIDGKDIDEPGDLDKKLQLLEAELNKINNEEVIKMRYDKEAFMAAYDSWLKKIITHTVPIIQKFNKLFHGNKHAILISDTNIRIQFSDETVSELIEKLTPSINDQIDTISNINPDFRILAFYGTFIKAGLKTFGCNFSLSVKFEEIKYELYVEEYESVYERRTIKRVYERLLHQPLNDKEMTAAADMLGNTIYTFIDDQTKKIGLR